MLFALLRLAVVELTNQKLCLFNPSVMNFNTIVFAQARHFGLHICIRTT